MHIWYDVLDPDKSGQALAGLIIKTLDLPGPLIPTVKANSNGGPYRACPALRGLFSQPFLVYDVVM
jgi:hypothetical protein